MPEIATDEYFEEQMKKKGLWYREDLVEQNVREDVIEKVPAETAAKYQAVPVDFLPEGKLLLVTSSEDTYKSLNSLRDSLGCAIRLYFTDRDNLSLALTHYYNVSKNVRQKNITVEADITPLKKQLRDMINDAIKRRASDIHLLPAEDGMLTYFRINGHLIDFSPAYPVDNLSGAINIIKGFDESGQTDTAKENMPNKGSFVVQYGNLTVDVRLSTVPLANGWQKVNLRLLPQTKSRILLNELGYQEEDVKTIRATLLRCSAGFFLNSGPTGSGKTTSLYAQLYELLRIVSEPLNIMTIEDPVEMHVPLFCQVQVREAQNEELSLTAPKILKTGLRQDPDVFLYGEIRDKRDAEVAIEAAITGHKVFSTVHAKNVIATIARLLDLGVSKTSLLSELNIILSQRLVGVLCPHCSQPHRLTDEEKEILSEEEQTLLERGKLREKGTPEAIKACDHCAYGYVGRVAVAEYIVFDNELRDALLGEVRFGKIEKTLQAQGFRSMWEKGLQMVAEGRTDLNEILRVIGK